jgi:hypothetical protein
VVFPITRATGIASKLAIDGVPAEMLPIDVESLISALTMFGDGDADGIAALDPSGRITALVASYKVGRCRLHR